LKSSEKLTACLRREIVNRILANSGATLGIAVLGISPPLRRGPRADEINKKAAPAGKDAAAAARGKEVFSTKVFHVPVRYERREKNRPG